LFNKFADMSRWQQNRNRNGKRATQQGKNERLKQRTCHTLDPKWAGTMAMESHFSRFPAERN